MHNSNKTKTISWRNCDDYGEHLYLMPVDISKYSFYTLNKYRCVLDVKWERYRYSLSSQTYERMPYSYVDYREFYPKNIYNILKYFSTLIIPTRKTKDYVQAITFSLDKDWYVGLCDRKSSFGILKLMQEVHMIYRVNNKKGCNVYYLNPVIYHDLSIKQMELYCKELAHLFRHEYYELPRNKGDCEYFTASKESILTLENQDYG